MVGKQTCFNKPQKVAARLRMLRDSCYFMHFCSTYLQIACIKHYIPECIQESNRKMTFTAIRLDWQIELMRGFLRAHTRSCINFQVEHNKKSKFAFFRCWTICPYLSLNLQSLWWWLLKCPFNAYLTQTHAVVHPWTFVNSSADGVPAPTLNIYKYSNTFKRVFQIHIQSLQRYHGTKFLAVFASRITYYNSCLTWVIVS